MTVKSNINISSSWPTQRAANRWSEGTQLAVKSIPKSIIHSQTQLAASRLMNWWTHPELPVGSWLWWQWRSRSWPGCCRQSCCQFLPCRIRRGCKPWPASVRFHHGYLQRICNGRFKKKKKEKAKKTQLTFFLKSVLKCDCAKATITMVTSVTEDKPIHRLPKSYIFFGYSHFRWTKILLPNPTKVIENDLKCPHPEPAAIRKSCNIIVSSTTHFILSFSYVSQLGRQDAKARWAWWSRICLLQVSFL